MNNNTNTYDRDIVHCAGHREWWRNEAHCVWRTIKPCDCNNESTSNNL